jgi:hypothetical protein
MDKGKGKAPAAPSPPKGGALKLPPKMYCAMGSGCLKGIHAGLTSGKVGRINPWQIKIKLALQNPAAWVSCGHVCCWEPVPGNKLPPDEDTCAKIHALRCGSRGKRWSYKDAMSQAVAQGMVPHAWLALAGLTEVGKHGLIACLDCIA